MSLSRRSTFAALLCLFALHAGQATSARAANVNVTNYNWLQIPSGLSTAVTTGVGSSTTSSFNTSGFSGHQAPDFFRWSNLWIPAHNLNNNTLTPDATEGKGDYWATVQLDQTRNVNRVDFKLWANEGTGVRRARVEGSVDGGASYTQIGVHDFGSMATGDQQILNVPITAGNYSHVRLRFNGTDLLGSGNADYRHGSDNRAGPGVYHIEVLGNGTVSTDKANYSNMANFGTTRVNSTGVNTLTFNGLAYTDGFLRDDGGRTGDTNPWEAGKFAQVDLGQQRLIGKSMFQWNDQAWGGTVVSLQWSNDNVTYTPVTSAVQTNHVGLGGAHRVTFDSVIARYFRVTHIGPDGSNGHFIFDEWMTFSPLAGVLSATPADGSNINMQGDTNMVFTTPITLQNVGSAGSQIGVISFNITGPDAALFDLSNFAQEILDQNESIIYNLDFLGTNNEGTFTAQLQINTSEGLLTYNLTALVAHIPEPSTFALLGLALVGSAVVRRRRRQAD